MPDQNLPIEDDYPIEEPDDQLEDLEDELDPEDALDGSEDSAEDPPNDDAGMAPQPMPHATRAPEVG